MGSPKTMAQGQATILESQASCGTLMAADHELVHFKSSPTSKPLWIKQDTHPLENPCGMFRYPNDSVNSPENPKLVPNPHHRIKDVFA